MFTRDQRLTKDKQFAAVFKTGRSSYHPALVVRAVSNHSQTNHFGVIVSNKVSKLAVVRNKLKRRVRYILNKHAFFLTQGFDVVVICSRESLKLDFIELEKTLVARLTQLRLINL